MKKCLAVVIVMAIMSAFSWGQENQTLPDAKKSGDEIRLMTGDRWIHTDTGVFPYAKKLSDEMEIMRGILDSTLKLYTPESFMGAPTYFDIRSFYLRGQGAVFMLSTAGLRDSFPAFSMRSGKLPSNDRLAKLMTATGDGPAFIFTGQKSEAQLDDDSKPLAFPKTSIQIRDTRVVTLDDGSILTYFGDGEKSTISITTPSPAADGKIDSRMVAIDKSEEMEERLKSFRITPEQMTQVRETVEKWQEEDRASWQNLLQKIDEIKNPLIDMLANYGDSLTTVQPEEYINLVLLTGEAASLQKKQLDVISARKSWITDYKTGRLTLDEFRQQVLRYNQ